MAIFTYVRFVQIPVYSSRSLSLYYFVTAKTYRNVAQLAGGAYNLLYYYCERSTRFWPGRQYKRTGHDISQNNVLNYPYFGYHAIVDYKIVTILYYIRCAVTQCFFEYRMFGGSVDFIKVVLAYYTYSTVTRLTTHGLVYNSGSQPLLFYTPPL